MSAEAARKHIAEIRRDKFGINEDGTKRSSPLERDLRQALGHLAVELYSKKHHFILELIQNAEDNSYTPGETAMLSMQLLPHDPTNTPESSGCLVLLNNEVGFQPDQVLSLCSVGQSTKTKHDGYIGEKGIGFKSIFQVSARPHVFSNGYQFCFQRPIGEDDLGYIVPHWVENTPDAIRETNARTAILVPLLVGEHDNIATELAAIAPETILFLNKLSALHVSAGTVKRTVIRDARDGLVSLDSADGQTRYFVARAKCPRPASLDEEKRTGIQDREVTIALPLTDPGECAGRVFAFLPTECDSGLPFLINADFLLTASREALLVQRPWNLWLRNCIAPAFVATLEMLLKQRDWRTQAYRFVPVLGDLSQQLADFLRPAVEAIHATLREKEWVLTLKESFVRPKDAWFASKTERTLLGQPDPPPDLDRFLFVDPGLERWRDRLKPLGVQEFTTKNFLEVINASNWLQNRDDSWWETAFMLLAERKVTASDVSQIPLIRCTDGVCRLPKPSEVFLVSETHQQLPALPADGPTVHLLSVGLQTRLQKNPTVWNWITQVLGLRQFSLRAYIIDRLLPWMAEQNGEGAVQTLLVATRFIAANLACLEDSDRKTLGERIPWIIEGGQIISPVDRKGRELVMPESLQENDGWHWVFVGPADRAHFLLILDDYAKGMTEEARTILEDLFDACAVTAFPDPALCELAQGGAPYNMALARCAREVVGVPFLRDCISPRWLRDLHSVADVQNGVQKVTALERLLKAFSVEHAASFLNLSHKHFRHQSWQALETESELGIALRTKPWLKTSQGYKCPSETFLDVPEIREFLGDSVPYALTTLSQALLEKLGVRVRLTSSVLISLLRQIRDKGPSDFALLVRIYRRLHDMTFSADVFRSEALVFLAEPTETWRKLGELVWEDAGAVFDEHFGYLEPTYADHDLHSFFTDKLKVPEEPEARQYAEVWATLHTAQKHAPDVTEKRLKRIIERLIDENDELSAQAWWSEIQPGLKVWTTAGTFAAPRDVYAPDDGVAAELFSSLVPVAWLPFQAHRTVPFLRSLGCRSLASALHVETATHQNARPVAVATILTAESKELIALMFCNGGNWRDRTDLLELLLQTEEYVAPDVTAKYSLSDAPSCGTVTQARDAFWHHDSTRLLMKNGTDPDSLRSNAADSLAAAFSGFAQRQELADTIYRLLAASPAAARRLLHERNWSFSVDQQKWLDENNWKFVVAVRQAIEEEPKRPLQRSKEPTATNRTEPSTVATLATDKPVTYSGQAILGTAAGPTEAESSIASTNPALPGATPRNPQASEIRTQDTQTHAEPIDDDFASAQPITQSSAPAVPLRLKKPGSQRAKLTKGEVKRQRPRREQGPIEKSEQNAPKQEERRSGLESLSQTEKKDVERQGRAYAIMELESLGYLVTEMSDKNPGYDLLAKKPGESLRIEVKAHVRAASKVFVTKREWKEFNRARGSDDVKWELWNIEFLAEDEPRSVHITRYNNIPLEAIEESGLWINLALCSFPSESPSGRV